MPAQKKPSKRKPSKRLSARQAAFVREYLVDLNATQAAIRAGYSAKTADSAGSRLLVNVKVSKAVENGKKRREERVNVKADDVLRELVRISQADLRKAFNDDGQLRPVKEWPDDVAAFVSSIEVNELVGKDGEVRGCLHKIKLWPKVQALELLMKHLGLIIKRSALVDKDGNDLLAWAKGLSNQELIEKNKEAAVVIAASIGGGDDNDA